jgi:hypothetical protein
MLFSWCIQSGNRLSAVLEKEKGFMRFAAIASEMRTARRHFRSRGASVGAYLVAYSRFMPFSSISYSRFR